LFSESPSELLVNSDPKMAETRQKAVDLLEFGESSTVPKEDMKPFF